MFPILPIYYNDYLQICLKHLLSDVEKQTVSMSEQAGSYL